MSDDIGGRKMRDGALRQGSSNWLYHGPGEAFVSLNRKDYTSGMRLKAHTKCNPISPTHLLLEPKECWRTG